MPAAALVLSLPFSLYSTVESLRCPSWRKQIPPWERSIPVNSWLGGYRYCAWHRFPLAATQAPPQPMPAQKVESLTYTTHGFSLECQEKFKAFRKTRMRYKETHQHFPLEPTLVIQTYRTAEAATAPCVSACPVSACILTEWDVSCQTFLASTLRHSTNQSAMIPLAKQSMQHTVALCMSVGAKGQVLSLRKAAQLHRSYNNLYQKRN